MVGSEVPNLLEEGAAATLVVSRIAAARPLAVRLSAELLAAECLALVPFPVPPGTS